jgi:RNA polymerase sigma-70 factor (ECF subfamily)
MNKNNKTEPHLVVQALAGDTDAFGKLYELYLDEIYHFVYYRVKSHQEAEDMSEAVFMKAWLALDENPPRESPFRLWLYRIARNTVYDHYRTRKEQVGLEAAMQVPAATESPEAVVLRWEQAEELKDKVQQLNEDHQEVLTCRFIVGLSHAATAVVMARSKQAVRALQYRAIVALRNMLTVEQIAETTKMYLNGNGAKVESATLTNKEKNHV